MYLYAETYAGLCYGRRRESAGATFTGALSHVQANRLSSVKEQIGYWRKANAIHQWFVTNCQDGEDDCREYEVDRSQLVELRALVVRVLEASELVPGPVVNGYRAGPDTGGELRACIEDGRIVADPSVAHELLPTTDGFFFGSTHYDQWYIAGLTETLEILDAALAMPEGVTFTYQSSW